MILSNSKLMGGKKTWIQRHLISMESIREANNTIHKMPMVLSTSGTLS